MTDVKGRRSGAAFSLRKPSSIDTSYTRSDGWTTHVRSGSSYVTATGGGTRKYETTLRDAYLAVQEALDLWAAASQAVVATKEPTLTDHVICWENRGDSTIRIAVEDTSDIVFDPLGSGIFFGDTARAAAPLKTGTQWDESLRYFRESQATDSLLDSVRNLWLATENLLGRQTPKARDESEGTWLKRAIPAAGLDASLYRLYERLRNPSFHAKPTRNVLMPHDAARWNELRQYHEQLSEIYLGVQALDHLRPGRSTYMLPELLEEAVKVFDAVEVILSDDRVPWDAEDRDLLLRDQTTIGVPIRELDDSVLGQRKIAARISGAELKDWRGVTRAILAVENRPFFVAPLEGDLVVGDADWLEVEISLTIAESRGYRRFG
jgi:hypothetical protein